MTFYLQDLGIACTLGKNKGEISGNLFSSVPLSLSEKHELFSGKTVPVGALNFDLLPLTKEYQKFNSRNNQLLKHVLNEIMPAIKKAKKEKQRIAIVMATSTSGMAEGEQAFAEKLATDQWPSTYFYEQQETGSPSLFASAYLDIQGPSYTISTACSAGAKALIAARRLIEADICDAVICGGVDTLCELTLNGFDSLELLSEHPCQPFDQNRDGITIGEGAAVFLLSKDPSSIQLKGTGESSDAHHISAPDPLGKGATQAINQALTEAKLSPSDIDYINLHGTGTPLNDAMESTCISALFGEQTPCSSTKSLTGHTLGASGAIEAGFLWLMLNQASGNELPFPPHHGVKNPDPDLDKIHLVAPGKKILRSQKTFNLMSNSFAFGGNNASLILGQTNPQNPKEQPWKA